MGFPYIQPLNKTVVDKLKKRESNPLGASFKYPFVLLSSPAIVTNDVQIENGKMSGSKIKDLFDKKGGKVTYYGCKIKNEMNPEKLYPTGATALGYDFNGKRIEVLGEVNRRVPPPIIESLEVNTDGENNTLKTANLKIKVFTLKQLEMFELFFLRPSMHVLVEFGSTEAPTKFLAEGIESKNDDGTIIRNTKMISNNNYDNFIKEYKKNFSTKTDARITYATIINDTNGTFDYVAGIVTGFSFTITENLTYEVDLTVSTANTMLMWLPPTPSKGDSNTKQQNLELNKFSTWVKKIQADLDIKIPNELLDEKVWENEFFNWIPIANKQEETKASTTSYISMRYIIELINKCTSLVIQTSKIHTDVYFTSDDKPLIPCSSIDGAMISYSTDLLIPGKMPQFTTTEKKDKIILKKKKQGKEEILDTKDNKINGYSFNLDSKGGYKNIKKELIPSTKDIQYGNLLNLFINYNTFIGIWRKSIYRIDVINQLLELINDNMYGLTKLILGNAEEGSNTVLTIKDKTLLQKQQEESVLSDLYRFKIGVSGSIVRGFEFNFELDDLQMGQAAFSSISMIDSATNPNNKEKALENVQGSTTEYVFTNTGYEKFDMSAYANADNFISLDKASEQITLDNAKQNSETKELLKGTGLTGQEEPKKDEATKEDVDLTDSLSQKSIKFKMPKDKNVQTLIFTDKAFIVKELKIAEKKQKTTSALTFLEITLIIDGTAGINCGEIFRVDGVPEVYNKNGFFQVTNVKHSIEKAGWKTIIEAGYRINVK